MFSSAICAKSSHRRQATKIILRRFGIEDIGSAIQQKCRRYPILGGALALRARKINSSE
jgi:hypothetical protein